MRALFTLLFATLISAGLLHAQAPILEGKPQFDETLCVQTAVQKNPRILKAQKEISRIDGVRVEITAQALPLVTANLGAGFEEDRMARPLNDAFWTSGVRIEQLVYSGGSVGSAIELAKLSTSKAMDQLQNAVDEVVYETRLAYYQVLLNKALIHVQEESVRLLEEELANQQRRLKAGTVTRFNVLRAEVELANAQPALIRAKNQYRVALADLARVMGMNYQGTEHETPLFEVVGELKLNIAECDLKESLEKALQHRADLKVARRQIDIENKQLRVDRADFYPRVSLFGGYDLQSDRTDSSLNKTQYGATAGVQGRWNIFDGKLTQGKVQQTQANLEVAQLTVDELQREIDVQVRQSYFRWQEAIELIASQQKTVEQAQESLRLANARFDAGAGTQLDVLNAQVALVRARTNELEALYDYNVAIANLERATAFPVVNQRMQPPTS